MMPQPQPSRRPHDLLAAVPLSRMEFVLRTRQAFGPKGDLAADVRGALGQALHRTSHYTDLFDPTLPSGEEPRGLRGGSGAPRPFVVRAPEPPVLPEEGGTIRVVLHGFHATPKAASIWAEAVDRAGADGFGRPRARFELVDHKNYDEPDLLTYARQRWHHLAGTALEVRVSVRAITPLRLMSGGRLLIPSPPALVDAAVRRASNLAALYGPDSPRIDLNRLIAEAHTLEGAPDYIEYYEDTSSSRYSHRQRRRIKAVGMVGGFTTWVGQELGLLLLAAEALHVGKATTGGMGRLRVSAPVREFV